jgi:hypothetical protein
VRWLSHAWSAASPFQRIAVSLVSLVALAAVSSVAILHPAPFVTPEPSLPPDITAPTLTAATLTSGDEGIGLEPPTQVISLNGAVTTGPAVRDSTSRYAFRTDEAGSIIYGGACHAQKTAATLGLNSLTFDFLAAGTYADCTVRVRDAAGNTSAPLAVAEFTVHPPPMSIAHVWNETLLSAIRIDRVRPPVVARNLFHTSAAMYDIWAAYDGRADTYLLGHEGCPLTITLPRGHPAAVQEAISFAMYRLINERYSGSPGVEQTTVLVNELMRRLGYDTADVSTDYAGGSAAALGNYVAQCYIDYGLADGSNEVGLHANTYYQPVNEPLIPANPGTQAVADLDRWQPLALDVFIDQAGNVISGGAPPFVGAEWGNVTPFAMGTDDLTVYQRDSKGDGVMDEFKVYHDPGAPPSHLGPTAEEYKWNFTLVAKWSSQLDPTDGVFIDISPASIGNDPEMAHPLPTTFAEYQAFFAGSGGDSSRGHAINPRTGLPYEPERVPRGDYVRTLAEFWADGPNSETPPGHWFTILNFVAAQLDPAKKTFGGTGPPLDDLEWDVKAYFTLGGAMHDAAISAWSVKGWYDYVRPITAIRAFDVLDITEEPGYIARVKPGDPLAGEADVNVGKMKIRAWRGPAVINDPTVEDAGVAWILAENWWPYQRPSFVTPPFAGYVSGHSTFSRAAADILTAITGDPYFPGGLGEFHVTKNEYLVFEDGPSVDMTLQWATYRDAADQTSLSRIWGGIHPPFDDIPGRKIGELVATDALALAELYFAGDAVP